MDDLSAIDWSKPRGLQPKPSPMNPSYPSLRPTPSPQDSGRSTPLSPQASAGPLPKTAPAKPAQDSFSNLVNFGSAKASQNLTLAQRQAQLEADKRRKEEERRKQSEAQFGSAQQWDALGSRSFTASPAFPSNGAADDGDLFAAFNKDTKVDQASHYPPPSSDRSTPANGGHLDLSDPIAWNTTATSNGENIDDDDPFGLNDLKPSAAPHSLPKSTADDDDFLGDLGRPVDEVRKKRQQAAQPEPGKPIENDDSSSSEDQRRPRPREPSRKPKPSNDAFDRALAQLLDYGFSPEDARRGLMQSGSGANAEAAANWLLDEAHRKAKQKSRGAGPPADPSAASHADPRMAAARGEADFTKSAAAVGNSLFKTANSLWKTGQKKVQQAVADFQQEGESSQPKWMRDAQQGRAQESRAARATKFTDEVLALDQSRSSSAPRWQQQQSTVAPLSDARSRLNRLAGDDDSFSSHVSANRRKKPAPPPEPSKPEPEPDLLFSSASSKASQPLPQRPVQRTVPSPAKRPQAAATPPRHVTPQRKRQIPPINPAAMQTSTKHRLEGTAHFKRGDYATAHSSYSSSISAVPATHPLMIVLLTNRALTALKTGEPKQAVTDADEALKLIGPGNGQGETVPVQGENGQVENRDMKELHGKALCRKAEALEQMEKWADAGAVWQQCVEAGAGGPTAIKGRQRCQNALAPKPRAPAKPVSRPRPKPSAAASLAPQKSSEAVVRLREANQAAAREDDEKFALSEKVDAKVSAWRDGKRDNLRALLGSMDKVLWESSGWKNVGMHELVMANKVKIVYMKAIAKTHPDKLPQDANTEVRLIAGLVFSTLNESWDRFKADNGL
ncbi:UBA domain-containing protein [Hirsutella rhossiliensis]|uniref:UBA domain-containing protein 7 n=1 Tax=Hirsutella rhossiliensis TaxID=111463 RepID=A0A9P8N454_9HYPO|nr:UBA domain-containing protein 7 [Hirsutella rhossiliensis]KAH0968048.1 UBA domain-containing protein 7 [Hirsutella rhossiliensis]